MRFVTLLIQRAVGAAIVRPTARWRDGMRDVAAFNAANSRMTKPGNAVGAGRRSSFLLTRGSRKLLLYAIYAGKPFREALRDLGLTPNQVWGLTKTDEEWLACVQASFLR
ncbi:MAG TPA: hypothetical protein VJ625_09995 [Propionibacteriaceae bacterium]|nr:hypothetical protein [Propionibacteriaceae bacterium]